MSTLKLTGSSSGSTSLTAPASGSDRAIAFPDTAGTVALTSDLGNLSYADQWRVNTAFAGNAEPIASNWERVDSSGMGTVGSAMTQSSGIFTFPATGIWDVEVVLNSEHDADVSYIQLELKVTTNNSSYVDRAFGWTHITDGANSPFWTFTKARALIDVTDTAQVKVKFAVQDRIDSAHQGHTDYNATYATFIRVGDT